MEKYPRHPVRRSVPWLISAGLILLLVFARRTFSTAGPAATPQGAFGPAHAPSPLQAGTAPALAAQQDAPPLLTDATAHSTNSAGWQSYPIYAGEMTSIAIVVTPTVTQTVYVGTRDAGVFKTTNGGQSWQPARNGLTFYPIRSLQIDPQHPNTLYAGTDFDGIWKSTDGGDTWADSSSGLDKSLIVFNIVMNPQNTNTLYAGLAGGPGLYIGHIYKSENGGTTWALQDTGIPLEAGTYINGVFALAVDPAAPLTLYAGTNYQGAFRSMNGGATWAAINDGLPFRSGSTQYREKVNALATDPQHANRLSAIIGGGYYTFENDQWQKVSQDDPDANTSIFPAHLYFHPTDPLTIYCAGDHFTISTNGGITWTQRLGWPDSGRVPGIAFHPTGRSFNNAKELDIAIQMGVTQHILPRVEQAYEAGERVAFGSLALSKAGISQGGRTLPWDEPGGVMLEQGVVTIKKQGVLFNKWASLEVRQIPNFFVFAYLAGVRKDDGSFIGSDFVRLCRQASAGGQIAERGTEN